MEDANIFTSDGLINVDMPKRRLLLFVIQKCFILKNTLYQNITHILMLCYIANG